MALTSIQIPLFTVSLGWNDKQNTLKIVVGNHEKTLTTPRGSHILPFRTWELDLTHQAPVKVFYPLKSD